MNKSENVSISFNGKNYLIKQDTLNLLDELLKDYESKDIFERLEVKLKLSKLLK